MNIWFNALRFSRISLFILFTLWTSEEKKTKNVEKEDVVRMGGTKKVKKILAWTPRACEAGKNTSSSFVKWRLITAMNIFDKEIES